MLRKKPNRFFSSLSTGYTTSVWHIPYLPVRPVTFPGSTFPGLRVLPTQLLPTLLLEKVWDYQMFGGGGCVFVSSGTQ